MTRAFLAMLFAALWIGLAVAAEVVSAAEADDTQWSARDVHAALRHASPRARCVVGYDIGGVGFDPYAYGDGGASQGPAMLHDRGLAPLYAEWSGGAERADPYMSIAFLEWALDNDLAYKWSPVSLGLC